MRILKDVGIAALAFWPPSLAGLVALAAAWLTGNTITAFFIGAFWMALALVWVTAVTGSPLAATPPTNPEAPQRETR